MSEKNRQMAKRWFEEMWNQRNAAVIDEMLHPDACGHMQGVETRGHEDFRKVREGLLDALPDLHLEVEDMVADGDSVVVRWRARGTHRGAGLGVPPSNKSADFTGMTWLRFADGKLVEGWDQWNMGGVMQFLTA
jgi:steroid delta-isomerase-like uncharacterized protein